MHGYINSRGNFVLRLDTYHTLSLADLVCEDNERQTKGTGYKVGDIHPSSNEKSPEQEAQKP